MAFSCSRFIPPPVCRGASAAMCLALRGLASLRPFESCLQPLAGRLRRGGLVDHERVLTPGLRDPDPHGPVAL
jgi:hypothetical protein